eukprot:510711-Rhodomonas_salina.1
MVATRYARSRYRAYDPTRRPSQPTPTRSRPCVDPGVSTLVCLGHGHKVTWRITALRSPPVRVGLRAHPDTSCEQSDT